MKKILLAMLMTISGLLAPLAVAQPASAAQGPLAGYWYSTDSDGSSQVLSLVGSGVGAYSVFYYDESATSACGGAPAKVVGTGRLQGSVLQTVGALSCMPGGNVLRGRIAIDYIYDAKDNTLKDSFGIVWHR